MTRLPSQGRRPGALHLVVAVLALTLVLAGGWLVLARDSTRFTDAGALPTSAPPAPPGPPATPSRSSGSTTTSDGRTPPAAPVTALTDLSFVPTRFTMSDPKVDAPVVAVQVDRAGGLVIPDDPGVVGWWSDGAAPGSPVGTVVVAGHVDSAKLGRGALFHLARAPVGATITMVGDGGRQKYRVQARRRYSKQALPWRSLFTQTRTPRLVVVTCGGDFDYATRHYTDNVVVVAVPVQA